MFVWGFFFKSLSKLFWASGRAGLPFQGLISAPLEFCTVGLMVGRHLLQEVIPIILKKFLCRTRSGASTTFARRVLEAGGQGWLGRSHLSPSLQWACRKPLSSCALPKLPFALCHPPSCPHGNVLTPSALAWLPQNIWACDSWAEPG